MCYIQQIKQFQVLSGKTPHLHVILHIYIYEYGGLEVDVLHEGRACFLRQDWGVNPPILERLLRLLTKNMSCSLGCEVGPNYVRT